MEDKQILKDMLYDTYLDGSLAGSKMFFEFIDKIYESKPDDFVLRRCDIKMLIETYTEMYNVNIKKSKN